MNTEVLKQWFIEYLESSEGKTWRQDYERTVNKVTSIKQKLENGYKLSAENDKSFLSELLKDDENGVASKGQSTLANDVFKQIIKDEKFLNVIEQLILDPSEESYDSLNSYGSQLLNQLGSTNRPLLFNRACASCTLDVSTIVDRKKFSLFVQYIDEQNIIEFPQEIKEKNWYQQNIYLVQKIREAFREELGSKTTDLFWLNMFLWDIYDQKVANSFNAKSAVSYLTERYPNTYSGTVHIAAFKTSTGRELALDPKAKTSVIFCDAHPPEKIKLIIKKEYAETDTRHHHLSTHAKTLQVGNRAFAVTISNLDELEKFCDWYEKDTNQTTALEHKIRVFLKLWPIERLKNLTIEEYHQTKNNDCFIAQIDGFDPAQGDPTMACYFDIWEPLGLGDNDKYYNEKPYSWNKRLGNDFNSAFEKLKQEILHIVEATQRRDLSAIDQIQFTKGLKWMIAFLYQDFSDPFIIPIVTETNIKRIGYTEFIKKSLLEFLPRLLADQNGDTFFSYVEKLFSMIRKDYLNSKQKKLQSSNEKDNAMTQPLNRILFGAAGTGKTYNTINHALSIIENTTLEAIESEDRKLLKKRFDEYKNLGRIKFVTFHQSFSYEDFVEGIRAETKEGNLTYEIKAGVFKEICDLAKPQSMNNIVGAEFGRGYILKSVSSNVLVIQKPNGNFLHLSTDLANLLLEKVIQKEITIEDISQKNALEKLEDNNPLLEPYIVNGYCTVWANLIQLMLDYKDKNIKPNQSYVLIVDEINRGNISRVFGELITLIEDSKRAGASEELSVVLPYSKGEFTVPNNLYIIGTMNSSDRSLTGLDIALRRRFTFIEMPPKPELLDDISVEGLNIGTLLKVINQRIEVLLDRDHCIGHANFMSLKKQPTLENLSDIFKQKIIPQLQEYFFDDWSKISLVLFQNGMISEDDEINISGLFPANAQLDMDYSEQKKIWKINDETFKTMDAFIKILGAKG